jgi:starvation-inducible DNA-binding protein
MAYHNDGQARETVAASLAKFLADSYTLYLKTHSFHWNVVGPRFYDLHKLFEEQYTDLQDAVDEIAERIRALGVRAPGSYSEFVKLASVAEEKGAPVADEMIPQLLADNRILARSARTVIEAAEAHDDAGSADLATQRLRVHEKAAWMLESLIQI